MERNSLNENLKQREAALKAERAAHSDEPLALDDSQRVKVLSPGRLVAKRFFRNRLAILGSVILILMFLFSFVGPLFYPYGQVETCSKHSTQMATYASASFRKDYIGLDLDPDNAIDRTAGLKVNSQIDALEKSGESETVFFSGANAYMVEKLGDKVFTVSQSNNVAVATLTESTAIGIFDTINKSIEYYTGVADLGDDFTAAVAQARADKADTFTFNGLEYGLTMRSKMSYEVTCLESSVEFAGAAMDDGFLEAYNEAAENKANVFTYENVEYMIHAEDDKVTISKSSGYELMQVRSVFIFDTVDGSEVSDELRASALLNMYTGKSFTVDGASYSVVQGDNEIILRDASGNDFAFITDLAIRDPKGNDSLSFAFKTALAATVKEMAAKGDPTGSCDAPVPKERVEVNEKGDNVVVNELDENGNVIYETKTLTVKQTAGVFSASCEQIRYLVDIYAAPSSEHILGLDSNGRDNFARLMYGGQVSLLVGFVVVFIEMLIGIILGGMAGYFGGWVDTLIMRLVDIFYTIPSFPILLIIGSVMDKLQVDAKYRIMMMMAVLGVLGWASIARLVRGQILSLREQDFMVATESTGVRVQRRIFRHLVPNVMPQLIVNATAALGSVILTESSLSYLGMGIKYPFASWGNIINLVTSSAENMINYTYIWVPAGILICLTVIAFNFVGDGLRDAFDPKMKR